MIAALKKYMTMCTIVAMSCFISYSASAQFADTPCDPQYYKSLESRAWLEAQREITQNQNLIFKPDSVLEYTCFDKQLEELADHAKDMFSETARWDADGVEVIEDRENSMDDSLETLVADGLGKYDDANFSHNLLGGRISRNYITDTNIDGGNYTCNVMQDVWLKAKCMDFIDREASDGFFTFAEYADGDDKRILPTQCGNNADWEGNINKANAVGGDPWQSDDVNTYLNVLFPETGCGSGTRSYVRTGLKVTTKGEEIEEHICVVPGCAWNGSTCSP